VAGFTVLAVVLVVLVIVVLVLIVVVLVVWVLLLAMDAHNRTGRITKVTHPLRRAGGTRQASRDERTCRSDSRKRSGKEIRLDARSTSFAARGGRWCDLRVLSCRLRETASPDGLHRKRVTRAPLF